MTHTREARRASLPKPDPGNLSPHSPRLGPTPYNAKRRTSPDEFTPISS